MTDEIIDRLPLPILAAMPPWMTSMRLAPILLGVALLVFGLPSLLVDRRNRTGALLAGALLSIGIETAQGTGLFGLYACAYRIVDVDDIAANALGALLGALLMSALLRRRAAPASSAGSLPT